MRLSLRIIRIIATMVILFGCGIAMGAVILWYHGGILAPPFLVTAAGSAAPAPNEQVEPLTATLRNSPVLGPGAMSPAPLSTPIPAPATVANLPIAIPTHQPTPTAPGGNVVVLNQVAPPAPRQSPATGAALVLPQAEAQGGAADRLPIIGGSGQTIWVPRAIEGCWQGTGGASLEYLGGCPNAVSGISTPIQLRWCFRRVGNQPLTLIMARGQYPGRVSQRWEVVGASGRTISLRETISYHTMVFMHVVDVGDWTCTISQTDQLECTEHELARCGPGSWMQPPWFRGSGWVRAHRVGG
jgi:hypothetical protein